MQILFRIGARFSLAVNFFGYTISFSLKFCAAKFLLQFILQMIGRLKPYSSIRNVSISCATVVNLFYVFEILQRSDTMFNVYVFIVAGK